MPDPVVVTAGVLICSLLVAVAVVADSGSGSTGTGTGPKSTGTGTGTKTGTTPRDKTPRAWPLSPKTKPSLNGGSPCIVTYRGKRYDIQRFVDHPGGDLTGFCGQAVFPPATHRDGRMDPYLA